MSWIDSRTLWSGSRPSGCLQLRAEDPGTWGIRHDAHAPVLHLCEHLGPPGLQSGGEGGGGTR